MHTNTSFYFTKIIHQRRRLLIFCFEEENTRDLFKRVIIIGLVCSLCGWIFQENTFLLPHIFSSEVRLSKNDLQVEKLISLLPYLLLHSMVQIGLTHPMYQQLLKSLNHQGSNPLNRFLPFLQMEQNSSSVDFIFLIHLRPLKCREVGNIVFFIEYFAKWYRKLTLIEMFCVSNACAPTNRVSQNTHIFESLTSFSH